MEDVTSVSAPFAEYVESQYRTLQYVAMFKLAIDHWDGLEHSVDPQLLETYLEYKKDLADYPNNFEQITCQVALTRSVENLNGYLADITEVDRRECHRRFPRRATQRFDELRRRRCRRVDECCTFATRQRDLQNPGDFGGIENS